MAELDPQAVVFSCEIVKESAKRASSCDCARGRCADVHYACHIHSGRRMSAQAIEIFLARLYVEPALRKEFLRDPRAACAGADLAEEEVTALAAMDRNGLALAAWSFGRKRASRGSSSWFFRNPPSS